VNSPPGQCSGPAPPTSRPRISQRPLPFNALPESSLNKSGNWPLPSTNKPLGRHRELLNPGIRSRNQVPHAFLGGGKMCCAPNLQPFPPSTAKAHPCPMCEFPSRRSWTPSATARQRLQFFLCALPRSDLSTQPEIAMVKRALSPTDFARAPTRIASCLRPSPLLEMPRPQSGCTAKISCPENSRIGPAGRRPPGVISQPACTVLLLFSLLRRLNAHRHQNRCPPGCAFPPSAQSAAKPYSASPYREHHLSIAKHRNHTEYRLLSTAISQFGYAPPQAIKSV